MKKFLTGALIGAFIFGVSVADMNLASATSIPIEKNSDMKNRPEPPRDDSSINRPEPPRNDSSINRPEPPKNDSSINRPEPPRDDNNINRPEPPRDS